MKIAFDSQAFTIQEYGGISRYISSLAQHLSTSPEIEARIFAHLHINAYLEFLPRNLVSGVRVPRLPKTGRAISSINQLLARVAINRFNPQILHETYFSNISSTPKGARSVVTVYDMIHELFAAEFPKHDQTSKLKRIATQRADHVICISESTRTDLLDIFNLPKEKVSVVYLGFDSLILAKSIDEYRESKPYLLYVGQRRGYKNFDGFLQAYASSSRLQSHFNIVCFGGGAFTENEKKLFSALNLSETQVLQISGSDNKLGSCYSKAALFVYPSLYEGFGIPPLEAMSLGCPVACSNNSSIPEVVGNAAEYFDAKDTESIREALERVLNSDLRRNELISFGKLRCAEFSWQRCARETLDVYRNLM